MQNGNISLHSNTNISTEQKSINEIHADSQHIPTNITTTENNENISSSAIIIPKSIASVPQIVLEGRQTFKFLSTTTQSTTVFVGNISESCNDNLIRHVLQIVGRVLQWRRVQGANAKLESFGFVEYSDPEDALRALRLVNGLQVCDKKLITKVDEKTRFNLNRFEQEQREYIKNRQKPGDLNAADLITKSREIEDEKIIQELTTLLKGHIVFVKHSYEESPRRYDHDFPNGDSKIYSNESHSNIFDDARRAESRKSGSIETSRHDKDRNRRKRSHSQDEEDFEKRRLERRRQQREDNYLNRLRRWQNYEKNLQMEIDKRKSREKRRKIDQEEKAAKLMDFLDRYDDDKDDAKYYRGNSWETKLIDRQAEIESDERDIRREQEDLKNASKTETITSSDLEVDPIEPEPRKIETSTSTKVPTIPIIPQRLEKNYSTGLELKEGEEEFLVQNNTTEYNFESTKPIEFGIKRQQQPPQITSTNTGLEEIFVPDEEVVVQPLPKKIKLTVIDEQTKMDAPSIEFGPESAKYLTPYERNKKIKKLVEKIPTEKDKIFAYDVKWFLVDNNLVEKKIKPWLKKRIFEYIGEEEVTLIEYLCQKIIEKSQPDVMIKNISMILDEEAEVFIIKLWRLLIYETEALSMGLVQD